MRNSIAWAALFVFVLSLQASAKVPLDYHAFGRWRTLGQEQVSNDGRLLVYTLTSTEDDGELVVRNLDTGQEIRETRGSGPVVSDSDRYVGYLVTPHIAQLHTPGLTKTPPSDFGILNVRTGTATTLAKVASFSFPLHSSNLVAAWGYSAGAPKTPPEADLTLIALPTLKKTILHDVVSYALSSDGRWVAYAVSPPEKTKRAGSVVSGVFVRRVADGATKALLRGRGRFAKFTFDENRDALVFLADRRNTKDSPAYTLYLWNGGEALITLAGPATPGMPAGYAPSDTADYIFSRDGQRLYFATAAVPISPPKNFDPIKVLLWNWQDRKLPTQQKFESKPYNYAAEVLLGSHRFIQLGSEKVSVVQYNENPRWALGVSDWDYQAMTSWDDRRYADLSLIDLTSGRQTPIARHVLSSFVDSWPSSYVALSPGGNFVIFWDEHSSRWETFRTDDQTIVPLTPDRTAGLDNTEDDNAMLPSPYGIAGWTSNDRSVLIYDRYDIWQADPQTGSMHLLTGGIGREQHLVFRYIETHKISGLSHPIPVDKPIVLSAFDETTKASGFYELANERFSPLIMLNKSLKFITSAKDADRIIFSEERFDEFPNLWATDGSFASPHQVTDANPQQAFYRWGTSRLINFTTSRGLKLQAILTTPDDFDSHRKYPMLVYVYERLTDQLYSYIQPAAGTLVNIPRYVSHGYVVLQPDIHYETGHTTASAVDCVGSAVKRVISMGFVDPARIGMAGHSFGGYEVNALITHTNLFAAAEGGASDSDLTSLYGGFWGTGNVQQGYYETGQGRLATTPWNDPQTYIENSPLYYVQHVQTPYLRIQDDQDGAVPYGQGVEFFSALRRAGKEAYMFTFLGEDHGLRDQKNMNYWTVHLDEFFDHFLLGTPEPDWMKYGVAYAINGQPSVESLFTPQPWPK